MPSERNRKPSLCLPRSISRNDLESSNRSPSTSEKQGLKHFDNQASNHLAIVEEQALLREILEETDIDSDDDLEDTGDCILPPQT